MAAGIAIGTVIDLVGMERLVDRFGSPVDITEEGIALLDRKSVV